MKITPQSRAAIGVTVGMLAALALVVGIGAAFAVQTPIWVGGIVGGWIGFGVTRAVQLGDVAPAKLAFAVLLAWLAWPLIGPSA